MVCKRLDVGQSSPNILLEDDDRVAPVNNVTAVAFSPDNKQLVTGHRVHKLNQQPSGQLLVWDTVTGNLEKAIETDATVLKVVFSPVGNLLAFSTSSSGIIHILETKLWKEYDSIGAEHNRGVVFAFSANGQILAFGGSRIVESNKVQLWDSKTHKTTKPFPPEDENSGVHALAFSPKGNIIALGQRRYSSIGKPVFRVAICDWINGSEKGSVSLSSRIRSLSFSPDEGFLAIGQEETEGQPPKIYVFGLSEISTLR
jgi:WD40 repeat protein